jgi:hypothetical protein
MVSMIKHGDAKVPWSSIPALAKAIDADPAELIRLVLEDSWPDAHDVIRRVFGTIVSENECQLLIHLRGLVGDPFPALSDELRAALDSAFSPWMKP